MSRNKTCNHHRVDNTLSRKRPIRRRRSYTTGNERKKTNFGGRSTVRGRDCRTWRYISSHATVCGVQHESVLLYCSAAWHAADSYAFHSMQRLVLFASLFFAPLLWTCWYSPTECCSRISKRSSISKKAARMAIQLRKYAIRIKSPKAAKAAVAESVWRKSLHSCWKMVTAGSARVQFATWTVLCWTGKSLMSSFSDLHLVHTAETQATEAEFARHSRSRCGLALLGFRKRDKVEHRS